MSLLNHVGDVGSWGHGWRGSNCAWVAWVAWVHKILAWVTWVAWVHKILVWVAWVAIIGVGQKSSMGKCLATESYSTENTTSSIEHYIIVPTEFIKLYSILTLFRVFYIQMKPVCDAFLDLFSNLFSLVFFKNLWLSLLLNMQKQ